MSMIKESLHHAVEQLNDEEAQRVLAFAQDLKEKGEISPTLKRLASDPAFEIPSEEGNVLRRVQPIQGKGIPASRLLVEDRR
jgi:hypothetical protein